MPNWVFNGLTIEGNPEQVKSLIVQMNKPFVHSIEPVGDLSFNVKQRKYVNPIFAFHNIYSYSDSLMISPRRNSISPPQPVSSSYDKVKSNVGYCADSLDIAPSGLDHAVLKL